MGSSRLPQATVNMAFGQTSLGSDPEATKLPKATNDAAYAAYETYEAALTASAATLGGAISTRRMMIPVAMATLSRSARRSAAR